MNEDTKRLAVAMALAGTAGYLVGRARAPKPVPCECASSGTQGAAQALLRTHAFLDRVRAPILEPAAAGQPLGLDAARAMLTAMR